MLEKDIKAYKFISIHILQGKGTPTLKDINKVTGGKSPRSAVLVINRLVAKGYFIRNKGEIELTGKLFEEKPHTNIVQPPLTNHILIKDPIYDRQTLVIVGDEIEYAKSVYTNLFDENIPQPIIDFYEHDSSGIGRTIFNSNIVVVLLRTNGIGTACHEAFHATSFHFNKIGMPLSDDSEEAWAYYQQYLINQMLQVLCP